MTSSRAYALWPARVIRRRALLAVASLALLSITLSASIAARRTSTLPAASGPAVHAGLAELPASARSAISARVGANDPAYRVHAAGVNAFRAVSAPQRLTASFEPSGVTISSASARVGLHLRAAGYGSSRRSLAAVVPHSLANRVSYNRDGLSEWYANGPFGVEQGFTVYRRPPTATSTALELSMAVSGNVSVVSDSGRGVLLQPRHGGALRYGQISASDSTGRALPSRILLQGGVILLRVDTARARFPVTVDPLIGQQERPTPAGEQGAGRLGFSVALSADGTTALVGAPGDNGFSGAAWVFTREGSTWTQQGPKLTAPEQPGEPDEGQCTGEASECGFGRSVALSADGSTALIGAPRASEMHGAAWVFTREGSTWTQFGERLTGGSEAKGDGGFGRSVALSADGTTALIGAPRQTSLRGAAWAFTRSPSGFAEQGDALTGAGEVGTGYFGRAVALSADGSTALIGGPGDDGWAGAAWVYVRSGAGWIAQGDKLTGGAQEIGEGRLGVSVALSAAGDTALVGARSDDAGIGAAWVFARSGASWPQQGPKLTAEGELGEGQLGSSAALSADGNTALIGGPHDDALLGAAWTFTRSGTIWTQDSEQLAGGEPGKALFGAGVALSSDGTTALIGAPREGSRLGGVWAFLGTPTAPSPPPDSSSPPGEVVVPAAEGGNTSTTPAARSGVLASTTSALPPPILALTGNVVRISGVVRVKLPGSSTFTLLTEGEQIPFGSIVDATHGKVSVTTADGHGGTQTMVFYEGEFKLTQRRSGLVVSILFGGDFSACPTTRGARRAARASATKPKHAVRKLWAEGHGSYSTKGNYATGAVLGTRWLTADLCEGTLIRVVTDQVAVTNLVTGRRLTVRAGHSYLARAKRSRGRQARRRAPTG